MYVPLCMVDTEAITRAESRLLAAIVTGIECQMSCTTLFSAATDNTVSSFGAFLYEVLDLLETL